MHNWEQNEFYFYSAASIAYLGPLTMSDSLVTHFMLAPGCSQLSLVLIDLMQSALSQILS